MVGDRKKIAGASGGDVDRVALNAPEGDDAPAARALVVFAHGKDSIPWGSKFLHLAHIANRRGVDAISPDYTDIADPDQRVARLLDTALPEHQILVLVGSSMGGYVSTVASRTLKPKGLFLMAPAFGIPGYHEQDPIPGTDSVCIVHGWQDETIPVGHSIRFARKHLAELHLIDGDHRLGGVVPQVGRLFEDFLQRMLPDRNV